MAKPSDLPAGHTALKIAMVAAVITHLMAGAVATHGEFLPGPALLDLILMGSIYYVALNLCGKPERFVQAFGAYCGVLVVLNIASMLMLPSVDLDAETVSLDTVQMIAYFIYLVWGLTALGHLLRFTFDLTIPISILASTACLLTNVFLLQLLFSG